MKFKDKIFAETVRDVCHSELKEKWKFIFFKLAVFFIYNYSSCLNSVLLAHKDMFVSNRPTGRGAVAPYWRQVKSLKVIHSESQREPRKTNHHV